MAPDASTYEGLVSAFGLIHNRCNYIKPDGKLGIYGHSSVHFCLPELASLLRKRTHDTVNFLLALYDCPLNYEYKTKTQGDDRIRRGCLSLLAGTTPKFMKTCFDESLTEEGFSSRIFFICAKKPRKYECFISTLTPEQIEHKKDLVTHIRNLASLYGCVEKTKEVNDFMQDWWKTYCKDIDIRIKNSPQLEAYYARKNIHVMKVAMAEHFSESLDLKIPIETFKKAIDILEEEEKNMRLSFTMESKNPIANISKGVSEYLQGGAKNFVEIMIKLNDIGDRKQIEEALSFLDETGQIVQALKTNEITKREEVYWKLKE
jgi:hypothetical protein